MRALLQVDRLTIRSVEGIYHGNSIAVIIHSFDRSLISRLRDLLSHSLFSRLIPVQNPKHR